jgi:diaminopimelate epimerase
MSYLTQSQTVRTAAAYAANGNKLGVALINGSPTLTEIQENALLRQLLSRWGKKINLDSIMVVRNAPLADFAADVFEPWGQDGTGLAGSWSTMCGNGMMAVALFFEEHVMPIKRGQSIIITTRSGDREVLKLNTRRYSVCMGDFTHAGNDLAAYVRVVDQPAQYFQQSIPPELPVSFSSNWSIGMSGSRRNGIIDGEPHVVLINNGETTMDRLLRAARHEGPKVTKNLKIFPAEINVNFVMVKGSYSPKHGLEVLACTHERGLGDNPYRSVTGACGTGATAIGATLYRTYSLDDGSLVHITMPAGRLHVYRSEGQFYLSGTAKRMATPGSDFEHYGRTKLDKY